ncbi:hypothetical protein POM88_007583 [Heracleum sosnowskyi]|uniref:BED-type domain-containing protein n=1 Tax=Heracleum sosnowskyi TaxID=360622 RepID=A0AAD8J8D4_9APIA|nr:hypothetical protein POM88_007583 [Heracleum sosnowskyi]
MSMDSQTDAIPDANSEPGQPSKSQPSTTPELHSGLNDSNSTPKADVIGNDNVQAQSNIKKGGSRLRSDVWQHYDRKIVGGVLRAFCKYCPEDLNGNSGSGTSHLRNHYTKKHKQNENMRQKLLTSNFNKNHQQLASCSFNQAVSKKELASMIIMHEYPISIVDHVGFRRNFHNVNTSTGYVTIEDSICVQSHKSFRRLENADNGHAAEFLVSTEICYV